MKNRIARLVSLRTIKFFSESLSELRENDVLVQIKAVGICGSDMHYFLEGGLGSFKQELPMDLGHEPAGVIVKVGSKGELRKGDRVAIEPGKPCFHCRFCVIGKHNLCENGTFMITNTQGALADYVIVDKSQVFKLPDSMSFEMGALLEPLGVGLHAVNLVNPRPYHSAVIVGAGPIGLSVYWALKSYGLQEIFMVDKLPHRVTFAKKMGAQAFQFDKGVEGIKKATQGKGVMYVFDAGGTQESINLCINVAGVGGTMAIVGIPTADFIEVNPHKMRTKELTIKNVRRSNQTVETCMQLYANNPNVEKMITHKFDFKDAQEAFDLVSEYKDKVIKCVITNNKQ